MHRHHLDVVGTIRGPSDVFEFRDALTGALYTDEFFSLLPEMIEQIEKRQTTIVSALLSNSVANGNFFSFGMHLSVQCSEELPYTTVEDLEEGLTPYPELEDLFSYSVNLSVAMFELCSTWGVDAAGPVENQAVTSSIPTMVLAGSFDPITPPRWGEAVAANFENSAFVEFPTLGHGVSIASDCSMSVTLAFFADPAAELDTSCITFMAGVDYVEEPFDPSTIVLELFEADVLGTRIGGVFPSGWEQVAPGSWARGATTLDRTELAQQAFPTLGLDEGLLLDLIGDQVGIDEGNRHGPGRLAALQRIVRCVRHRYRPERASGPVGHCDHGERDG